MLSNVLLPSARRAPAMSGRAVFFEPLTGSVPRSGCLPWITSLSIQIDGLESWRAWIWNGSQRDEINSHATSTSMLHIPSSLGSTWAVEVRRSLREPCMKSYANTHEPHDEAPRRRRHGPDLPLPRRNDAAGSPCAGSDEAVPRRLVRQCVVRAHAGPQGKICRRGEQGGGRRAVGRGARWDTDHGTWLGG